MSVDLAKFQQLKQNVDRLRREADRAEGALAQLMDRLKTEHECETLEEAEAKLKGMEKKAEQDEKDYNKVMADFQEEWGSQLDR